MQHPGQPLPQNNQVMRHQEQRDANFDYRQDPAPGDHMQEDPLERGRRRSKNDTDGRDHKCKYCDKTYLSYPALYTHTKQKHSTGPDGELRAPPTSGRGRGRPRKNVLSLSE